MAKIGISFKNNTKEQELYHYFNSLEDKSGDIKKILQEWYNKNIKQTKEVVKGKVNDSKIDIRNF